MGDQLDGESWEAGLPRLWMEGVVGVRGRGGMRNDQDRGWSFADPGRMGLLMADWCGSLISSSSLGFTSRGSGRLLVVGTAQKWNSVVDGVF